MVPNVVSETVGINYYLLSVIGIRSYYIIFFFFYVYFVSEVIYATGYLVNKDIQK